MYLLSERMQLLEHYTLNRLLYVSAVIGHHRADFTTCVKEIPRWYPPTHSLKNGKSYTNQHRTNALNQFGKRHIKGF